MCEGIFMAEKTHSLVFDNKTLTVKGVEQVVAISDKEAQFKLSNSALTVKGNGLNVTKLDKEQGVVALEVESIASITYRANALSGIKGLFR